MNPATLHLYARRGLGSFLELPPLDYDFGVSLPPNLTLPPLQYPTFSSSVHTVVRGESLTSVAARYGVTRAALIQANPALGGRTVLRIGEALLIPDRATATTTANAAAPPPGVSAAGWEEYKRSQAKQQQYLLLGGGALVLILLFVSMKGD